MYIIYNIDIIQDFSAAIALQRFYCMNIYIGVKCIH